jgi:abhydrolase domain-containing protein 6
MSLHGTGKPGGGEMKKKIGIVSAFIVALLVLIYFAFPGAIYRMAILAGQKAAGLTEKSVQVDDHRIVYLEGGKGATVLLIHGYSADRNNWLRFARYLTPKYRVVIPDLAGFGESSRLQGSSYDIESQVKRLDRFTGALNLASFHLAGNSMGGQIAGVYAAVHSQKVLSLGLFAPGGIKSPEKSELWKMLEKGTNPLLINSADDFDRMLKMVFVKVPPMPYPVKKAATEQAIRHRAFNEKIAGDLKNRPLPLEPFLPRIKAPALILWGDRDNLLHVSSVPVLEKAIRKHRTVIMKDCGHIPMLERPVETADHYLAFLKGLPN